MQEKFKQRGIAVFRLDGKHLEAVKEIAVRNRKRKKCNRCYDRGYIGVTEENLLVLCPKCVDMEKSHVEWKEYVKKNDDLHEHFKELLEEEDKTGEE